MRLIPEQLERKIINGYGRITAQKAANRGLPMKKIIDAQEAGRIKGEKISKKIPLIAVGGGVVGPTIVGVTFPGVPFVVFPILGFLLVVTLMLPLLLILYRDAKRTARLEIQMEDTLRKVGTSLATGMITIPGAIFAVAEEREQPIKFELERVYSEMVVRKRSFDEAIMIIAKENDSILLTRACALMASSYRQIREESIHVALTSAADMISKTREISDTKETAFTGPILKLGMLILFLLPIVITVAAGLLKSLAPMQELIRAATERIVIARGEAVPMEVLFGVLPVFLLVEGVVACFSIGLLVKRNLLWTLRLFSVFAVIFLLLVLAVF